MTARDFIGGLFSEWEQGDSAPFFEALAADVIWTTIGRTPISGTFRSKQDYLEKVYQPLLKVFDGATACRVQQLVAEGNSVVVEWHGKTPLVNGETYSQDYCWVIRVNDEASAITEVRGYFDTARVERLLAVAVPNE